MKVKIVLGFLIGLAPFYTYAKTLQDIVGNVLESNPTLNERLKNYQTKHVEIGIDEAGYYPTVTLESAVGRKATGRIDSDGIHQSYNVFQNSLRLKQNIFNGFATQEKVNYRKMHALSAAYTYLDQANDIALQTVTAYISLQKEKELLENAKLNVKRNTATYNKIKKAHDAGLTTLSEVSKIYSTLSLAKSNLMLQKNRLMNAQSDFRRVVGKTIDLKKLQRVNFHVKLPKNQKKAEAYALQYNPSVISGTYTLKGAEALYRESQSAFYPKLDLELSQNYNDNYNEYIGTDDRAQALLVLSYNLYNGGADEAKKVSALSKMDQEVSVVNDIKRQVTEKVDLSWNSYTLAQDQIPFLKQYKKQSQSTLNLYNEEYELGNRSLLDLISVENDLKRANDELIYAKYNLLLAKYGIMHSMGLTVASILGNQSAYYKKVRIQPSKNKTTENSYRSLHEAMQRDTTHHVSTKKEVSPLPEKKANVINTQNTKEETSSEGTSFFDTFTKVRWESR